MSASLEARIAEHGPILKLRAPLGYRAAGSDKSCRHHHLITSTYIPPDCVPEAEMPPRKRACLTTPAPGYEIGESSAAGAARQPRPTPEVDTWDEIVEAMMEIAPTTLEGVDQRVTELDTTVRQRTEEFEIRFEEAHDDRAYLGALVNSLYRDRPYHRHTALALDREAVYARIAWTSSEERSAAIEAHVRTLEALKARDPEPQDGPAEAGSSNIVTDKMSTRGSTTAPHPLLQPSVSLLQLQLDCSRRFMHAWTFAFCTLQGSALTWWNSHVRAVGQDVAYTMPWTALKRMITDKYSLGFVGGLPDMIHGSVKASKPQSMQEGNLNLLLK
ncbi:hypothetical protein Tco_0774817 [Tanacetum coccineum]|uniref:Retrotransposon gag domain-containing protein n=1 Tax=Tanacetum coccineum TaxID=301880 RepID=A0ABQ4ZSB9_9ASTR